MWLKIKKNIDEVHIGVAKIFNWGEGPNRKSHAMKSLKIFEKRNLIWDKDFA